MKLSASPVTYHQFEHFPFYLKRDDLLHPQFSGNKARKFMKLLEEEQQDIDTLIGYGSVQANSLYSLAALAKLKGWKLEYYVDHIPSYVTENPKGNYRAALELGASIIDPNKQPNPNGLNCEQYIREIRKPNEKCLFIPEGGRCNLAEYGVKQLAEEIVAWQREQNIEKLTVALPSGTGTTSLYLQKHLEKYNIQVLTCACVGGNDYLKQQWQSLQEPSFPTILDSGKKHHFGKLYQADFDIWKKLKTQTDVEFDLLYDPLMWRCLMQEYTQEKQGTLLYIHQGGLLGNETMLPRYLRKFGE
ncbi:putative Tryptophan synthase beta superfamily [Vibrio nigripulchritudo MADA3029]|uniref:pyridoxal-phosphate dependent enzyme n=1 Tax=Vibrio nigripulchritudo TaxID=28173 RepID=UPI0003B1EC16|nr:pyridoxal-phosphate dependent enzyme [Vibrio nigripulchritudo]CCN48176.1 putative Tryptophan synthase beta superfamily [Vibrio nigripulchritudo MADA3020]CCN54798.1 putative Tryptophan synthase beta superfamily [Vibrio nigripulchritudo MADA3021]CCN58327.1 putative Tryptophan synthase beta superfamily [Vibrio nigripulchritudo MADA3029]